MRGLSTLTEILTRGEIFEVSPSILRKDVYICIFKDGTQANIDIDVYKQWYFDKLGI
jgi:hypothetical protein